jgi:hypothetical protein
VRTTGPVAAAKQPAAPSCRNPDTVCPSVGDVQRIPSGSPRSAHDTVPEGPMQNVADAVSDPSPSLASATLSTQL